MASDSFQFDQTSLQWQPWTGCIPNGAVSIYNKKCNRTDYVAKYGMEAGFYCPSLDHYCHYGYGDKEFRAGSFDILVNKDNFEFLEWKPGSWGSVPQNAVRTIQGINVYVGRSTYGLGKVTVEHQAFFYPWEGKEYWYKSYEVLTFSRDIIKEKITDVNYKFDMMQVIHHPPDIISKDILVNATCRPAKQISNLSQSITESNSWSTTSNLAISASATITAGVPNIASMQIGMSVESSFGFNRGSTQTKATSKSLSVEVEVLPKHSCTVKMEARMHSANIPFTAQLQRTYRNGHTTQTTITGTYKGIQVAEVRSVLDPCVPLQ